MELTRQDFEAYREQVKQSMKRDEMSIRTNTEILKWINKQIKGLPNIVKPKIKPKGVP